MARASTPWPPLVVKIGGCGSENQGRKHTLCTRWTQLTALWRRFVPNMRRFRTNPTHFPIPGPCRGLRRFGRPKSTFQLGQIGGLQTDITYFSKQVQPVTSHHLVVSIDLNRVEKRIY